MYIFFFRVKTISMGEGQIDRATKLINDGMLHGNWVVIENCHVDDEWLNKLEIICLNLSISDDVNEDFRLWLTSCPSEEFPMIILQMASKINMEQPAGVAANVSRLLAIKPWQASEMCTNEFEDKRQSIWQRCIFSLVLFHAIVEERRAFSPIGWNIPYEIYQHDLVISLGQLNMTLANADDLPMAGHTLLIGDCNYGGRFTDERDQWLLKILLDEIFNDNSINADDFVLSEFGNIALPTVPTLVDNPDHFRAMSNLDVTQLLGLSEISVFDQDCDDASEVYSFLMNSFGARCLITLNYLDNIKCIANANRNSCPHRNRTIFRYQ